jgi:hypothetical protein
MKIVFQKKTEAQVSNIPSHDKFTSNNQRSKLLIESNWKKFARVGSTEKFEIDFTDCKTGDPVASSGLSIVEGIVYVSDHKQISKLANSFICFGPGSPLQFDKRERNSCNSKRWCAEYETKEPCEGACHAVTGERIFGLK